MDRSASEVSSAVSRVLDSAVLSSEHLAGYANDNWKVTTADGERYAAKFGPLSHEAKWRSAQVAHTLALEAGLPVAPPVHFGASRRQADAGVRMDRRATPTPQTIHGDRAKRLFSDLGLAVKTLQSINVDAFSSRLDESATSFPRWADYITHRLTAIRARCETTEAVDDKTLRRATGLIGELAQTVTDSARPTLVHRDLYADNLLVDRDGHLVAILDFDTAEVWDAAGEWFKLNWLLFPSFPDSATVFAEACWAGRPPAEQWKERIRLVDLVETLNVIPNAITQGWQTMEIDARRRLRSFEHGKPGQVRDMSEVTERLVGGFHRDERADPVQDLGMGWWVFGVRSDVIARRIHEDGPVQRRSVRRRATHEASDEESRVWAFVALRDDGSDRCPL